MACAMVVDDAGTIRKFIASALSDIGIEAVEAENGQVALDKLNAGEQVDFLLVDWNMPVMNGLELVQAVRSDSKYDAIPMIMVTTEAEMERVVEALGAGANEYLMKPFTSEALTEKLQLAGII